MTRRSIVGMPSVNHPSIRAGYGADLSPLVGIRAVRLALRLSADEVARRLTRHLGRPVHPDTLRNIELGHRRASVELHAAWLTVLGVPDDVPTYRYVCGNGGDHDA